MLIDASLQNIDSYIAHFNANVLPVLRRTKRELAALSEHQHSVNARQIAGVVLQDPLMALRLLSHLEAHRSKSQNHDITTIDRAIMMLGVGPFFNIFDNLPTIEDSLSAHPRALVGLLKVIGRSKNAARYARDWALLRHDMDIDEITVATLLHDAAEIVFWCFAPGLMEQVKRLQQSQPGTRSAAAQKALLGVSMDEAQLALAHAWRLPQLLISLLDDAKNPSPRAQLIVCATNLARHSANGWDDPALPDDYRAIADLLHLSVENTLQRLGIPSEHWPGAAQAADNPTGEA